MLFVPPSMPSSEAQEDYTIPSWIKNNADWWADEQVADAHYDKIIHMMKSFSLNPTQTSTPTPTPTESVTAIPSWIKNNAEWWADGVIDDNTFISGIQHLVKVGIIKVS